LLFEGIVYNSLFGTYILFNNIVNMEVGIAGQNIFSGYIISKNPISSLEYILHDGKLPVSLLA